MKGRLVTPREFAWIWVSFALFGLLAGLLGCVRYIPQTAVWPTEFQGNDSIIAVTTCDMRGNPIILVNSRVLNNPTPNLPQWSWRYILIHEETHASEIRGFKEGCQKFLELYRSDSDFRMMVELRAKCAEYIAMKNDGIITMYEELAFVGVFGPLYNLYGQHLEFEEFLLRIPCRPP